MIDATEIARLREKYDTERLVDVEVRSLIDELGKAQTALDAAEGGINLWRKAAEDNMTARAIDKHEYDQAIAELNAAIAARAEAEARLSESERRAEVARSALGNVCSRLVRRKEQLAEAEARIKTAETERDEVRTDLNDRIADLLVEQKRTGARVKELEATAAAWAENPFVCAISFSVEKRNIDT